MQQTRHEKRTHRSLKLTSLIVLNLAALLILAVPPSAFAATILSNRYDKISSSVAGDIATHEFGFGMLDTATPIGSISFEFCSNSPIIGDVCNTPTGLNVLGATLALQSGDTGFTIDPGTTANRIIITRSPSNPAGVSSVYQFTNIINPTSPGSYYVRLQTFSSTDATGTDVENGGLVFAMNPGVNVNAEVPPFLRFCASVTIVSFDCTTATGFFINLGEFSTSQTSKAASQMVAVTNAASGYSIFLSGTSLTSGNNVIPPMTSQIASSPGTSQFGINLRANTTPAIGTDPVGPGTAGVTSNYNASNQFRFVPGEALVSTTTSNDNRKFTVSYIANISTAQASGVYATTVSFICLANF